MRFCRFNRDRLGVVKGTQVHDVTEALEALPDTAVASATR